MAFSMLMLFAEYLEFLDQKRCHEQVGEQSRDKADEHHETEVEHLRCG